MGHPVEHFKVSQLGNSHLLSFSTLRNIFWTVLLGGVVGLWTGFSALAVAELMSLLISLLLYCSGCTEGDIEKKDNKVSFPKKSKNKIT